VSSWLPCTAPCHTLHHWLATDPLNLVCPIHFPACVTDLLCAGSGGHSLDY